MRADAKPQLNGCFWHISSGSDHCRLSGWVKGEQPLCYEETKTSPSGVLPDPDVTCRLTVYSPCKIQAQSTALPPPPPPHHKNDTRPETLQHSPLELFCSYLLSNKDGEEISHIHLKTGDSSNFYVLISKLQFSTFLYFFCCRFWVFHHQFVFCDSAAKTIIVAFSISEPSYTFDHKIKEQKSTAATENVRGWSRALRTLLADFLIVSAKTNFHLWLLPLKPAIQIAIVFINNSKLNAVGASPVYEKWNFMQLHKKNKPMILYLISTLLFSCIWKSNCHI